MQSLFQLPSLRRAIYEIDVQHMRAMHPGRSHCMGLNLLAELQKIFALMEYGKRRTANLSTIVKMLNVETGVQQDANEFNKLFLQFLATHLKLSSNKRHRNLIRDHFSGTVEYCTKCDRCGTESKRQEEFLELEVHIENVRFLLTLYTG